MRPLRLTAARVHGSADDRADRPGRSEGSRDSDVALQRTVGITTAGRTNQAHSSATTRESPWRITISNPGSRVGLDVAGMCVLSDSVSTASLTERGGSMTAAFLSYSLADRSAAAEMTRVLRSHGIEVLTGMTVPAGSNLSRAVLDEMENADAFVFLISKQFVRSQWTQIEVAAAMAQVTSGGGKRLIPVLLGSDLDPDEDVPPLLRRFVWLDLREGFNEQALAPLVAALTDSEPPEAIEDQLAAERELLSMRWRVQKADLVRERAEVEERYLRASLRQARLALYLGMLSTSVALAAGVLTLALAIPSDGAAPRVTVLAVLGFTAAVVVATSWQIYRGQRTQRALQERMIRSVRERGQRDRPD